MENRITAQYNHRYVAQHNKLVIRLAMGILVALVVAAFICQLCFINHRYAEWKADRHITEVTVSHGDTLDEFGYQFKPEWMDIREYRDYIIDLNNLTSSDLHIGQTLKFYVVGTEYTTEGYFADNTLITPDGNEWSYDTNVRITFNDNGTPNDIEDDIIVDVTLIH